MSVQRLHNIWYCMRHRCNNPKNPSARWYHDKGIRLCSEWESSFSAFESWALCNGYSDDLTIDRIDPDGNYTPENCRWISKSENSQRARRRTGVVKEKEKAPKIQKEPRSKRGRFMVVRTSIYTPYYYSVATVIKTGLTKPEAGKYARELSEKDHYGFRFSVYITDGHKEGDKEFEKDLRYFISSKYAYRQN